MMIDGGVAGGFDSQYDDDYNQPHKSHGGTGYAHSDEQEGGGQGGFDFGSFDEHKFLGADPFSKNNDNDLPIIGLGSGPAGNLGKAMIMFTSLEINIFIPKDPNVVGPNFNLNKYFEEYFDKLEKLQYFVTSLTIYRISVRNQVRPQQKPS